MIQLLFSLLAAEAAVVVLLLVKTPLRKLVVLVLDRLKRGRAPVMARTVAATVFVVLVSTVHSMVKIQRRSTEAGLLTPTDQVLWSRHMLEASLMGYSLFLSLIIDRMHHYIREIRRLRKNMESVIKQNRILEEDKSGGSEEIKARDKEIAMLRAKIAELESEHEAIVKEIKNAEASTVALRKQSEGFLLEYDRLSEDNQNLRQQLKSIDRKLSHSDSKKIS